MSRSIVAVAWLLALGSGCGAPEVPPEPSMLAGGRLDAAPARVAWSPGLVEDGGMFQDEARFRGYLRRAEVVAIGVLDSWDGTSGGTLRVERVLRGRVGGVLPLRYSGGIVRPAVGRRVMVLLSTRDGRMELHSFCAASGLYELSGPLAAYVEGALAAQSG